MKKWQANKILNDDIETVEGAKTINLTLPSVPMTEGRRRTLSDCMDATMFQTMKEIQIGGRWATGLDVIRVEREVHEIYMTVMRGLKKLSDYRAAVEQWQEMGTIH